MGTVHQGHRTKIVATLGPASQEPDMVRKLIQAGMNVARINGSHGSHEEHRQLINVVREQAALLQTPVGILFDLQGPKIRVGRFTGPPRQLQPGDRVSFAVGRATVDDELPTDYDRLDRDVKVGDPLLIDDGEVNTEVVDVVPGRVTVKALYEGQIEPRKGINLPASDVSAPALSEKDREDAAFALEMDVDMIALSFVRRAEDIRALQQLIDDAGKNTPIVAKIEKPQALDNLEEILEHTWGVMVARGDLGVELLPEQVPMAQKRIIREANRHGAPVITATQMLDSMKRNPRPTRAETSDVANAVMDGTDAVMLSGETAVGKYPRESVEMMGRIVRSTEVSHERAPTARRRERGIGGTPEAVADACCQVAHHLKQNIVVFTQTGRTAVLISQRRPARVVYAFTPHEHVRNRLCLVWGVQPFLVESSDTLERRVDRLDEALLGQVLAERGDRVVVSMAAPNAPPGSTSLMMVHEVGKSSLVARG